MKAMNINENTRLIDLKVSDLLNILKEATPSQPVNIPIQEAEEIGGYDLAVRVTGYARQTLYQLKSSGNIPHITLPNGGVRFSKKEIINWLMGHHSLSSDQIKQKADDIIFKRKLRRK